MRPLVYFESLPGRGRCAGHPRALVRAAASSSSCSAVARRRCSRNAACAVSRPNRADVRYRAPRSEMPRTSNRPEGIRFFKRLRRNLWLPLVGHFNEYVNVPMGRIRFCLCRGPSAVGFSTWDSLDASRTVDVLTRHFV